MSQTDLTYQLKPVDFDPFAGPQIELVSHVTEPQEEIWTSCLMGGAEASCAYNESISLALKGQLDRTLLENALQEVVKRHEALRSVFSPDGVHILTYTERPLAIGFQDISSQSETEQLNYIASFLSHDAKTAFNLISGPLFRAYLFKLGQDAHYLRLTAHHIVCDGWSLGIILQDISKLYTAYVNHQTANLPVANKFSQYAVQQRAFLQSNNYQSIQQYWLNQYKNNTPQLNLPVDYPRPPVRTYKSHREDIAIDRGLIEDIKKAGASAGCSFVTTLLAAFEVFLYRLTGQQDMAIALPAAGQSATGNYNLVGHCVNVLPLRTTVNSNVSFADYLKIRRTQVLDAYENQPFTLGSLLKKTAIPRDASRLPITPVMFNTDMGMDDGVDFYGLSYRLISNPREYETFELFLNISDWGGTVVMEWSYNSQLFKQDTIQRMAVDFTALLHDIVSHPEKKIKQLLAYDAVELNLKLAEWNDTYAAYPKNIPFTALINKAALQYPDKVAINFEAHTITYQQLINRSNQFARLLLDNKIQPGDAVGLAVDRSADMVVALLGIAKAGAAYVPLDPDYPLQRINFMLDDSSAKILITSKKYKGRFKTRGVELILDDVLQSLSGYNETEPDVNITGSSLAYILYTSGTTGAPKGVQITHYNLVNFLCSMQKFPGINSSDKLLAVTTISFDIAGLELYLPLISGAQLLITNAETVKDGRELLRIIKTEGVNIMQATPYTWRIMLQSGWDDLLPLKALCGGEALPADLAHKLSGKCKTVFNMYGPTETTIWSAVKQVSANDDVITIGRPIDNTQVYVLDDDLDPLPPGAVGEIYIAGDGLAQGYLNQHELTGEKFIHNPFSLSAGSKMYRTGDMGKYLPNGELLCLGRADQQVKIRGFRIETGEIEQALMKQPDIKDAAVIAREDHSGNKALSAYIVADDTDTTNQEKTTNWRASLKNTLPDYMLPADFIILPAMPLTPNGKTDRNALPRPSAKTEKAGFVEPRTDVERMVADIWKEHLGLEKISVYDNFFELGGHSFIAIQVMNSIENQTGKHLPLSSLFSHGTIEQLTLLLAMDGQSVTWDSLVPIKPTGNKMPLYIVHGAGLHVLLFNTLAMNMDADQPIYGLQAKGMNGIDEPLGKMEDIAAHYISEIIAQNPTGPYALAGYSFGGIIAYEMTRQLEAMGKKVSMLAMFDTYAYRSDKFDPPLSRILTRSWFFIKQLLYSVVLLAQDPKRAIEYKTEMFKRRVTEIYWRLKHGKDHNQVGFMGYSHKIDRMNAQAERNYKLLPYPVTVDVFRARKKTFYMEDFKYLGWKPYALKGVNIYDIPGEHNYIFAPPNNIAFAGILQKCLDKAAVKQ